MQAPTVIVTGASQGLGAAIASIAAARGARVVLTARSEAALQVQCERIRQGGGTAMAVAADITKSEDCREIVDRTVQTFATIDALVNNAATIEPLSAVADVAIEDWKHQMAVNVFGPATLCQLAIPHLRQSRGRVVNVTSHGAESIIPGASAYSASKAALNQLSRTIAAEEPTIAVLLIIPGEVDTPMQAAIRNKGKGKAPDDVLQYFVDLYEQGRLLPPETPALAAVALALAAPLEWSGEILEWNDARVQELVESLSAGTGR